MDKDWLAVAQVYATLAQAHGVMACSPGLDQEHHRDCAVQHEQIALVALKTAQDLGKEIRR